MVRSVINLSLADLAADPDSVNMVNCFQFTIIFHGHSMLFPFKFKSGIGSFLQLQISMVEQDIAMTASKVKDPATWAMLQLLRADVTDSVRWADSALVYTDFFNLNNCCFERIVFSSP